MAAAILPHPVHGLALVRYFRESVCQDFEALRGTVLTVCQLFGGVRPVGGQPARDGVRGIAHEYLEIVPRTVSRIQAFAFRHTDQRAARADGKALAERLIAPAQADHVVELRPVQESVVGGVKDHQAAASADVRLERLLHFARPASAGVRMAAVEIVDHDVVGAKVRLGGPCGDCDRETAGTFEDGLNGARAGGPIVIVHAVDDERGESGAGGGRTGG